MDPVGGPAWNRLPDSFDLNSGGGLIGLYAGYNWQFTPNYLIGIEVDVSRTWNKASASTIDRDNAGVPFVGIAPTTMERDLEWLGSLRARFGYVLTNNALLYATGGLAWGAVHYTSTLSSEPAGTTWNNDSRATEIGYVLGGGLEWMMTPHMILRGEYLFYHLSGESALVNSTPLSPPFQINWTWNSFDTHVARLGISYKF